MARHTSLVAISNPLISSKQLLAFQKDHKPSSSADAALFHLCLLTQTAGILLRLPQEVVATSIILFQRHWVTASTEDATVRTLETTGIQPDGHSIVASSASIYLSAKQSFYPLSPRSVINVYALLTSPQSSPLSFINPLAPVLATPDPRSYYVSEGTYQARREKLFSIEKEILASIGFDTKVVLPYSLALTYLQSLSASTAELSEGVLAHLNAALLNPQLLYLTHQPNALAVAAIYLTAREQGVPLVDDEVAWWEVFDVGREELGFLVLSLGSLNGFVNAQARSSN